MMPRIPTEAEVAELVSRAGEIARGLAFQRDMLQAENVRLRASCELALRQLKNGDYMNLQDNLMAAAKAR